MERVIAYVDGFNLYFGLRSKRWKRYYWLNIQELAGRLLRPDQELVLTRYFTAMVSEPPDKRQRHAVYVEAIRTLSNTHIHHGRFLKNSVICHICRGMYDKYEEKMSDVNIAVQMLLDAVDDRFDSALLISADSDLLPVIEAVKTKFASKRIIVAFPPGRSSAQLRLHPSVDVCFAIGRGRIAQSVFPDTVFKPDGRPLMKPPSWK